MSTDLDEARAAVLLDAIVETERAVARAMAEQAELIAELHECSVMAPQGQDPGRTVLDRADLVEAELAAALHVSTRTADTRVEVALALTQRLPGTLAALRNGGLDWNRARIIADETSAVAISAAHDVRDAGGSPAAAGRAAAAVSQRIEDQVLVRACGQTPALLRRSLARAVIAVDPTPQKTGT